jgi:hypothetical protein
MKTCAHFLTRSVIFLALSINLGLTADPIPLDSLFISNASLPCLIYRPGNYFLIEDLMYEAVDGTPAITIASSEVGLSLNSLSLNQSNGLEGVSGISIQPGSIGCTINNGSINNFSQTAISAQAGASVIILNNLLISGCGKRAIEFNGKPDNPMKLIEMSGCTIIQCCKLPSADNVVTLLNCSQVEISNCLLSGHGSPALEGPLAIFNFTNCSQVEFANNATSDSVGNTEINGLYLNNCSASLFRDNKTTTLVGTDRSSRCRGVQLVSDSGCTQNNFKNCLVTNLAAGALVDGFLAGNGCNDNYFSSCLSAFHSATEPEGSVHGFHSIGNSRNKFTSTVSPYGAYGFTLDRADRNMVLDCLTSDNRAASASVGFYAIQTTKCHWSNNRSIGNTQGYDFNGTFDENAWVRNIADKNDNSSQYRGFPDQAVTDNLHATDISTITSPYTNIGII